MAASPVPGAREGYHMQVEEEMVRSLERKEQRIANLEATIDHLLNEIRRRDNKVQYLEDEVRQRDTEIMQLKKELLAT